MKSVVIPAFYLKFNILFSVFGGAATPIPLPSSSGDQLCSSSELLNGASVIFIIFPWLISSSCLSTKAIPCILQALSAFEAFRL